jgi:hypothetical protein
VVYVRTFFESTSKGFRLEHKLSYSTDFYFYIPISFIIIIIIIIVIIIIIITFIFNLFYIVIIA